MAESTVKLSIILPAHVHTRTQEIAAVEGLPIYKVVADALVEYIEAKRGDAEYRRKLVDYVEARQKEVATLQARIAALD